MMHPLVGKKWRLVDSVSNIYVRNIRTIQRPKRRELPIPKLEKRLDVVIMGSPNAGKSVLLNNLIKNKLAATSRKRHTTRGEILGVFNHRNIQLAFYDTPGFETPTKSQSKKKYSMQLSKVATSISEKADVILLVVDAEKRIDDRAMINFGAMAKVAFQNAKKELILVVNKVDLVNPKSKLLEITRQYVSLINGVKLGEGKEVEAQMDTTTFLISGLQNDGVLDLKNYLISCSVSKPWIIPASRGYTNLQTEERVEQIVLESMLDHTHDEIPYICEINCTKVDRFAENKLKIYVEILVDSSRQQKMCVGYQGRTMLKIRQKSCEYLERILNKQCLLYIDIRVRGKENSVSFDDEVDGVDEEEEDEKNDDDDDDDREGISQQSKAI